MGSNDLPPYAPTTPQCKPPLIDVRHTRRYAGDPAVGAGSRSTSCGTGSSWAEDEGSATVGSTEGGGGLGDGSTGGGVRVGVGCGAAVVGAPGFALVPGLGALVAAGLAAPPEADGEAEPEADSPGLGFPCPCFPSPPDPPNPIPPPGTPEPPSGASPACCPAECEGLAPPPASSPTLMQPAAAATTATAAARRTGTYMGRTGPPPRRKKGVPLSTPAAHRKTRAARPSPIPGRELPLPRARGYDAIETRVTRSYERFVGKGEFTFRARTGAVRLDGMVQFRWDTVAVGGGLEVLLVGADGRIRTDYMFPGA